MRITLDLDAADSQAVRDALQDYVDRNHKLIRGGNEPRDMAAVYAERSRVALHVLNEMDIQEQEQTSTQAAMDYAHEQYVADLRAPDYGSDC